MNKNLYPVCQKHNLGHGLRGSLSSEVRSALGLALFFILYISSICVITSNATNDVNFSQLFVCISNQFYNFHDTSSVFL